VIRRTANSNADRVCYYVNFDGKWCVKAQPTCCLLSLSEKVNANLNTNFRSNEMLQMKEAKGQE
jgi:hypothetical protein